MKASLRGVGLQAIEIGVTVGIGEENPLLVNAALGDMVCHAKGNGARKSGHLLKSGAGGRFLSSYHISPSPKFRKGMTLQQCAAGYVDEACGGNYIYWGK